MVLTLPQNAVFELKSDPRARSRAVAAQALEVGRNVLVESPLAIAVHPSDKGRRCDQCLRELESLQKCSGCGVYWYCGRACQSASWRRHHRRLCGFAKSYVLSSSYKDATSESQADTFLLAHLAAEHFYKLDTLDEARSSSNQSVQTFWDLLPSHSSHGLIPSLSFTSPVILSAAAGRFSNNNFVVHDARLVPYAHGVFALASRSFNHSCRPNAVAMFEETEQGPHMVVKLIQAVAVGEEICISYTDPASPGPKRRDALQHAYGFICQCPRCITDISDASRSPSDLREQIQSIVQTQVMNPESDLETVRTALATFESHLDEVLLSSLPDWTADFSSSSHDGPYDQALRDGNAVLGVYLLVYPGSHPLLELHCLELCKVAWNLYITSVEPGTDSMHVKQSSETYLRWATQLSDDNIDGLAESRKAISAEYRALADCLINNSFPVVMSSGTDVWLPDIKIVGIKEGDTQTSDKNARAEISGANNPPISGTTRRRADARLAEDKFGEEMAPDATIWELYEEEANNFDDELIKGRSNNLDMLLLFAGIFSAVVTSFIIESKNMLQQDSGDASLALLLFIAQSQQRLAEGNTQLASAMIEIPPFEVTHSARWINGLWFTSLALSLGAALLAMLAKEWLIAYASSRPRSPYDHVVAHQRRLQGLGRWHALHIIDFLPTIVHFALLLFSLGLVVYLWILDYAVAASIVVIVGLSVLFYATTAVLAAIYPFCPFVTQISKYIRKSLISSHILNSSTDAPIQSRSSIPVSLEALQALKWLAENAQDQVTADCTYQALSGIKLSHNPLENPRKNLREEQQTQLNKAHIIETETHYTLLSEIFETICNQIPLALASESGQLSANQGISASRYANALPHLVWYLETTSVKPIQYKKKAFQDYSQSLEYETPAHRALTTLDFAWSDDRPHYTADTYAFLTAAELHLIAIAASQHKLEPSVATTPSPPAPENTSDSKIDVSAQSWLILDVEEVATFPVKKIPLFDLRARFSRALFRAAIELKHHADKRVNIRDDALAYLLGSIRLGFSCPALNPEAGLSTHHRQDQSHEGPPLFSVEVVGAGSGWSLRPTEIDDEDGLIIGLMRVIDDQATSEFPEIVHSAMHTFCTVAPVLLRQWLGMNRDSNFVGDERTRITLALSDFQTLHPMITKWGVDIASTLRVWTMGHLLLTMLISSTFLASGPPGVQRLSGRASQILRKLTKGSVGQMCALQAAIGYFPLVLEMIQRTCSKQLSLPEIKDLVRWLLVKLDIHNAIIIQGVRNNYLASGTDAYLELLELWARVPGLESELEELVSRVVEGYMADIMEPLWSVSGFSKLASIGDHAGYAPILSRLVAYMINASLEKDRIQRYLGDPQHRAALPHFVNVVGRALSVASPGPERTTLSEAYACSISSFLSFQQHLQANLSDEGLGPYEDALKMIRHVSPSALAASALSDQFVADYKAILNLADDSEAWMIGLLPWMLEEDSMSCEGKGLHESSTS